MGNSELFTENENSEIYLLIVSFFAKQRACKFFEEENLLSKQAKLDFRT
jgi:hypothetical protein